MSSLRKTITITTVSTLLLASFSAAQGYEDDIRRIDYAKVISAEPVYQTVERRVPVENCWTEQQRQETPVYYSAQSGKPRRSATGTLLGAVIGGGIGNAVGAGEENKKVGTVVGAILGATIGNDVSRRRASRHETQVSRTEVSYRDVQRCEVQDRIETERVAAGYRVSYRYHGQTYHTRTENHPGDRLKVAVSIEPVEY